MPLREVPGRPSIWVPPQSTQRRTQRPSHEYRRVNFFLTTVRRDDLPHRCLGCSRVVRVGEQVVSQRSASERTPNFWGPIEEFIHDRCWESVPGHLRPPLGRKLNVWIRYNDDPWHGLW